MVIRFSRILCLVCWLGMGIGSGEAGVFTWHEVRHRGHKYVKLSEVKQFYGFSLKKTESRLVLEDVKTKIIFSPGSQRCQMNGVLFILTHSLIPQGNDYLLSQTDLIKLLDPVLRPTHIRSATSFDTVVLDAGHGGADSGSRGFFKNEKYYTLKLALKVRELLIKKGFKVIMTRQDDRFISLSQRVKLANGYPHAVFISLHFNSGRAKADGVETFTVSPVGVPHMGRGVRSSDAKKVPGNAKDSASIALATAVHSRVLYALNSRKIGGGFHIKDRGIKRARFNVLTGITIPAVLLEGGFLSNKNEAMKISKPSYIDVMARGIVRAVEVYASSINRRKKR